MSLFGVNCVESNYTVNDGFGRVQSKLERESFQRDLMTTHALQTHCINKIFSAWTFYF